MSRAEAEVSAGSIHSSQRTKYFRHQNHNALQIIFLGGRFSTYNTSERS